MIREASTSKDNEILNMVNESLLAKELSTIYTELRMNGECNIDVNNWLNIHLLIKPPECKLECLPFHTLLFKDNPKRLENLISDKSNNSVLMILIKKCKYPINSFKCISEDEGSPYQVVCEGALHFTR